VRLHDQDLSLVPGLLEPSGETRQISSEGRTDVGVHDRGAEALVLLDLRQHLGRERHVGGGKKPLEGPARGLLVTGIAIGVEIADRDRVDARLRERPDRCREGRPGERCVDATIEPDPLLHAQSSCSRHEWDRRRHAQVVAVVLEPLAHLDDVAVALGGEHADGRALSLEQGVGRDGGAVHDHLRLGQEPSTVERDLGGEQVEPVHHTDRRVRWRGSRLRERNASFVVHRDQIRERAADVDPDAKHVSDSFACARRLGAGRSSRSRDRFDDPPPERPRRGVEDHHSLRLPPSR
jgi:hypothetical protein